MKYGVQRLFSPVGEGSLCRFEILHCLKMQHHKKTSVPANSEAIVRFYDRMGEDYRNWSPSLHIHFGYFRWGMNPFNLESMLDRMTEEVMLRLKIAEGDQLIIDAGCGVGASGRYMARRIQRARVHGVTISPWQVAFGEKLNGEAGLSDRITLFEADFQAMPFPENHADAAFAIESACYAGGLDKSRLVGELVRVLKPGGRLVVVDGFRKHGRPFSAFFEKIYRRYLALWAVGDLADLQLFKNALKEHGFRDVRAEDITWNVTPTGLHIPWTILKIFIRQWVFQRKKISPVQKNYMKALALTLVVGLWKKHFGYYIVTCVKK